jgi:adenylate kinase family enzyme
MKVLVFGNSGCRKSTYAQAVAARHGLPHLELDSTDRSKEIRRVEHV